MSELNKSQSNRDQSLGETEEAMRIAEEALTTGTEEIDRAAVVVESINNSANAKKGLPKKTVAPESAPENLEGGGDLMFPEQINLAKYIGGKLSEIKGTEEEKEIKKKEVAKEILELLKKWKGKKTFRFKDGKRQYLQLKSIPKNLTHKAKDGNENTVLVFDVYEKNSKGNFVKIEEEKCSIGKINFMEFKKIKDEKDLTKEKKDLPADGKQDWRNDEGEKVKAVFKENEGEYNVGYSSPLHPKGSDNVSKEDLRAYKAKNGKIIYSKAVEPLILKEDSMDNRDDDDDADDDDTEIDESGGQVDAGADDSQEGLGSGDLTGKNEKNKNKKAEAIRVLRGKLSTIYKRIEKFDESGDKNFLMNAYDQMTSNILAYDKAKINSDHEKKLKSAIKKGGREIIDKIKEIEEKEKSVKYRFKANKEGKWELKAPEAEKDDIKSKIIQLEFLRNRLIRSFPKAEDKIKKIESFIDEGLDKSDLPKELKSQVRKWLVSNLAEDVENYELAQEARNNTGSFGADSKGKFGVTGFNEEKRNEIADVIRRLRKDQKMYMQGDSGEFFGKSLEEVLEPLGVSDEFKKQVEGYLKTEKEKITRDWSEHKKSLENSKKEKIKKLRVDLLTCSRNIGTIKNSDKKDSLNLELGEISKNLDDFYDMDVRSSESSNLGKEINEKMEKLLKGIEDAISEQKKQKGKTEKGSGRSKDGEGKEGQDLIEKNKRPLSIEGLRQLIRDKKEDIDGFSEQEIMEMIDDIENGEEAPFALYDELGIILDRAKEIRENNYRDAIGNAKTLEGLFAVLTEKGKFLWREDKMIREPDQMKEIILECIKKFNFNFITENLGLRSAVVRIYRSEEAKKPSFWKSFKSEIGDTKQQVKEMATDAYRAVKNPKKTVGSLAKVVFDEARDADKQFEEIAKVGDAYVLPIVAKPKEPAKGAGRKVGRAVANFFRRPFRFLAGGLVVGTETAVKVYKGKGWWSADSSDVDISATEVLEESKKKAEAVDSVVIEPVRPESDVSLEGKEDLLAFEDEIRGVTKFSSLLKIIEETGFLVDKDEKKYLLEKIKEVDVLIAHLAMGRMNDQDFDKKVNIVLNNITITCLQERVGQMIDEKKVAIKKQKDEDLDIALLDNSIAGNDEKKENQGEDSSLEKKIDTVKSFSDLLEFAKQDDNLNREDCDYLKRRINEFRSRLKDLLSFKKIKNFKNIYDSYLPPNPNEFWMNDFDERFEVLRREIEVKIKEKVKEDNEDIDSVKSFIREELKKFPK